MVACVAAYGSSGGRSGGYSSSGGGGGGGSGYSGQVIPGMICLIFLSFLVLTLYLMLAAIQSRHEIQFRDVPTTSDIKPATVEVGAGQLPLTILFKSASSNLNIRQVHDGAQGSTQESNSEDEPHILRHS